MSRDQLVERFYDAVVTPSLWPQALEELADMVGGCGVALLSADRPDGLWVRIDPAARAVFDARFRNRNPFAAHVVALRRAPGYRPALVVDDQVLARSELRRTDYFNDFLRPFDSEGSAILDLGVQGISAAVNIGRTPRAGSFEADDVALLRGVHADLARAFWLSVRLGLSGALHASLVETLAGAIHGCVLLDATGAIVHANPAAERLFARRQGLFAERGRLATARPDDRTRLDRAIAYAAVGADGRRAGAWLAVARAPPSPPLKVTVSPLALDRPALFQARARVLVAVIDADAPPALSADEVRALFGLTAAQARLALKLAEGCDLKSAAQALGVTLPTARTHLYEIFARTGANRQADLVRLLVRAGGG